MTRRGRDPCPRGRGRGRGDRRRRPGERGAATLLVVAAAGLLLFVGLALSGVSAVVVAQRRAQSAADLAALSGATAAADGRDGCAAAAATARANDAVLVSCVDGADDVRVSVRVRASGPAGRAVDVVADARAGPG
ncbi:Rv3654c family TadE-like protein [Nocardioides sp. Soil777]|uniref:Rv3654c family TadE-like protein n=1 Tax=Nocardioides sp. Soil777 TaxID=1736409 RepID=UPI0009EC6468|nr:Rv3654c family TadE-like protein [Nocardioides sp. Soil777]